SERYGATHVSYDQVSFSGLLNAYEKAFGSRMLPSHDFSKAKTIVSFGADFLGTWPNHTGNSKQFASTRKLDSKKKEMSRLYSFESNLSLTGANADYRTPIRASQEGLYVANLYNALAKKLGGTPINVAGVADDVVLMKAANDLIKSMNSALVVSGSNDVDVQLMVIAINHLLGSYGRTIDTGKSVNLRKGNDQAFESFVKGLNSGAVAGVIFYNCNPVYDHPLGSQIEAGLAKAKFALSTSGKVDETSALVKYQAPDNHFLESWNDFEPVTGSYSLSQPAIKNIFDTRQAQQSFLTWSGDNTSYYDFVRASWNANVFAKANTVEYFNFDAFWDKCLHDGVFETEVGASSAVASVDVASSAAAIGKKYSSNNTGLELVIYQNNCIGDGSQANNPWLQEMPDPITKATWDNYLTVSAKQAREW
ncbi:MAG: molybdopterin oxidoreductase, partial [Marinoscillum sp.]